MADYLTSNLRAIWHRANQVEVPDKPDMIDWPGDTVSKFVAVSNGFIVGRARWHYPTKSWCHKEGFHWDIVFWSVLPGEDSLPAETTTGHCIDCIELKNALAAAVKIANEARECHDRDQDMRTMKLLIALSGHLPKWRADTDRIHDVLRRAVERLSAPMPPEEPRPAQNYHCNICGGDVRFPDGAKPSISIGPGNKSRLQQTDAPDDGAMRGIASEKASVPPCVYRTGCQNQEACKAERVCMADLAQKLRAQSAENGDAPR